MATTRKADTHWEGSLLDGKGNVTLASSKSGTFDVTWASRATDEAKETSPEELIAAAHATCYSMALSHGLAGAGTPPNSVDTHAEVDFQPGEGITGIRLVVRADVPGLSAEDFQAAAENAKANCPVSKALAAVPSITLDAALV
ncbi:OsmC family protein [Catenulispora acidiphila DSM 44928]|uniref:OsmC family protein n=1 Tax=Catenulispora acidiphila (strain DSM 44928 / JCM 14897 / NBRC 102108 / NRRL B-24433 / ID139908) TaxID=479433 RepID=C7Q8J0_CATAD|nr:OsmC family peroxiredoxin [Catenulispora acidiphila]ACU76178.1 OsmC family protein [Catenulispora acidiphila DSM 44928]